MGAVICLIIVMSLVFAGVGCWIYLASIAELGTREEYGEDIDCPSPVAKLGICLFIVSFTIISNLMLALVGGKIASAIVFLLAAVFAGVFGFAMISSESLQSSSAYGCTLPFFSIMFTSAVVFTKPNPIGLGLLTIVFFSTMFMLWLIVRAKNRSEEDWLYEEEE